MIALLALLACKDTTPDDSVSAEPAFHCGVIVGEEVWSKQNNPHTVTCDLDVEGGSLTIEAGVEVLVYEGLRIRVAEDGTQSNLTIAGTSAEPVSFRLGAPEDEEGTEPDPWDGLEIYAAATAPSIAWTTIERGGAAGAGLRVYGAELAVEGLSVLDSPLTGVVLEANGRLAEGSTGLTVRGSGDAAVVVDATNAHTLPAEGSDYTGNALDQVQVQGGEVVAEVTWEDLGVPYVLYRDVEIVGSTESPAGLRVGPGAVLLFDEGNAIVSSADGGATSLVFGEADGEPVTLAALDGDENGYWTGVYAYPGTSQVELYNTSFSLGGGDELTMAALRVEGEVEVMLQNVSVSGSANDGIVLEYGASLDPQSRDIYVSNCINYPLTIRAEQAHTLVPVTFVDNGVDGARVLEGTLTESVSWEDLGAPYVIADPVFIEGRAEEPATLTLEAGTNLLLDVGAGFTLAEGGGAAGLVAAGEPTAQVQFHALRADQDGFWGSIIAYRGVLPGDFTLRNTVLDGGGGLDEAMVLVWDSEILVENVVMSNSRDLGFELRGAGTFAAGSDGLELDSNFDQGMLGAGAVHTLPENLHFSGQTDLSADSRGFHVLFVTSDSDVRESVTWWALPDGGIYWPVDRIALDGTAEAPIVLTIEGGSTFWMGDGTGIYVSAIDGGAAGLIVGSDRAPTVFTSAEADVPGRWYGIRVMDHCLDGSVRFENTTIANGGKSGDRFNPANLLIYGCSATIDNVTVLNSDQQGLIAVGDVQVSDSTFEGNYLCGLAAGTFEEVFPTLSNLSYADNLYGDLCTL